jgi:NADPH:quinone reductase-like Zn-dependent oxidoreductase
VLDTIGGETQERSWSVLKKGGVLVSLVQPPSEEKAEELGVRAALLGAQPNGAQLAESRRSSTQASSHRSSIAFFR